MDIPGIQPICSGASHGSKHQIWVQSITRCLPTAQLTRSLDRAGLQPRRQTIFRRAPSFYQKRKLGASGSVSAVCTSTTLRAALMICRGIRLQAGVFAVAK